VKAGPKAAVRAPLSRVGFFLFAETLRAWVGSAQGRTNELGRVPTSWGGHGRPISTPLSVRQIKERMGALYEALSRATFWPIQRAAPVKGGLRAAALAKPLRAASPVSRPLLDH
jgi:hypothetical protein